MSPLAERIWIAAAGFRCRDSYDALQWRNGPKNFRHEFAVAVMRFSLIPYFHWCIFHELSSN